MIDLAGFIITFRESIEAILVICIILSYLHKTNQKHLLRTAWLGVITGIIGSIIIAILFSLFVGEFSGFYEEIFEGITMLIGAILITYLIVWLLKRNRTEYLHKKINDSVDKYKGIGLFLLVSLSILREGVETVLFLYGLAVSTGSFSLLGPILGLIAGLLVGYLVYKEIEWIPWKNIFFVTSLFLVLFAAGLVSSSMHEFSEAGLVSPIIEHVWDINPPLNPDGTYPLLHDKGIIGGLAKGLFGYRGAPSLLEIISYVMYLLIVGIIYYKQKSPILTLTKPIKKLNKKN